MIRILVIGFLCVFGVGVGVLACIGLLTILALLALGVRLLIGF